MNKNNEINLQNIDINLLKNIATDRRLSAIDVRILLYFISMKDEWSDEKNKGKKFFFTGRQEDIADALNVTRENVNRAITKLVNFGYLYIMSDVAVGSELYLKTVYNVDTGEFEVLTRKVRAGDISYIVSDNVKCVFTIAEFMDLINTDVKNSKDKLLTEDVYKLEGALYRNIVTNEIKNELTISEKQSHEFEEISKVKILDRVSTPEVKDLLELFKVKYERNLDDETLDISDIVMLAGGIEYFENRCSKRVYNAILGFKNRYLDNLIDYYINRGVLDNNFLHLYNRYNKDIIKNRQIKKGYLMKLLYIKNRDTTQARKKLGIILDIIGFPEQDSYSFLEVLEMIKYMQEEELMTISQPIDGLFNLPINALHEIYDI